MRKGISYQSQTRPLVHHNEFPRETNSQRKVENQTEPTAQHNKKLPEFWWSKVSLFTSPWGHIPWEHGHQESSDPLAVKCLFHAGPQRTYADLLRKSVQSENDGGQGHTSILGTTRGRERERGDPGEKRIQQKGRLLMRWWFYLHSGWRI